MNEDYWYPWLPIHFERDTLKLTFAQEGAYRRLIDKYMLQGGAIQDDDRAICRLLGCALDEWMEVAAVVRGFFTSRDGKLYNKKADLILSDQEEIATKYSKRGKAGAKSRWGNKKVGNASRTAKVQKNEQQPDGTSNKTPMQEAMLADGTGEERTGQERIGGKPPLPPAKVSPGTPPLSLAKQIRKAFDDARAERWGENQRRPYHDARDEQEAERWIADGADLELCRDVFRTGMKTWRGTALPKHLGVFTPDIGEALVARKQAKANVEFDDDAQELTRKRIRVLVNAGFSEAQVQGLGSIHRIPDKEFDALIAQVGPVAEGAAA